MTALGYVLCTSFGVPLSRSSPTRDQASLRWDDISRLVVIASQLAMNSYSPMEVQSGKHTFLVRCLQLGCNTSACVSVFFEGYSESSTNNNVHLYQRAGFQLFYLCHFLKSLYGGLLLDAIGKVQEVMNERLGDPSFTGQHLDANFDNNNVDVQILAALEESGALPALILFEDHFVNKLLTPTYIQTRPGISGCRLMLDASFGFFSPLIQLVLRYCEDNHWKDFEECFGVYLFYAASGERALTCELQHTFKPSISRLQEVIASVASSSTEEIAMVSCGDICLITQSYCASELSFVQVVSLPVTLIASMNGQHQSFRLPDELVEVWRNVARKVATAFEAVSPIATENLDQLPEMAELFEVALTALNCRPEP